ncbi:limit dextrinase [Trifolium repens]|nr:limit dextrinase [Trifolium repens]
MCRPHIIWRVFTISDVVLITFCLLRFSANDLSVQPEFHGGYLAFTLPDSARVLHLKKLSGAGITHVRLLPTFQFAGVDDQKENWRNVDTSVLESFPPDSDKQQALITAIQNFDGYSWACNLVLWGVPKGSYASNPNGPTRAIEFRKMVQETSSDVLVKSSKYEASSGCFVVPRRTTAVFVEPRKSKL